MIETLIMEWLKKSVVPQARESGGTFFVEYGRPFKAVSIAAWLIAVAVAILCALPSTSIAPQVVLVIPGGFFLLALFLHSEFFLVRITYGVAGVDVYSKGGGQRSIAWHEIEGVQSGLRSPVERWEYVQVQLLHVWPRVFARRDAEARQSGLGLGRHWRFRCTTTATGVGSTPPRSASR